MGSAILLDLARYFRWKCSFPRRILHTLKWQTQKIRQKTNMYVKNARIVPAHLSRAIQQSLSCDCQDEIVPCAHDNANTGATMINSTYSGGCRCRIVCFRGNFNLLNVLFQSDFLPSLALVSISFTLTCEKWLFFISQDAAVAGMKWFWRNMHSSWNQLFHLITVNDINLFFYSRIWALTVSEHQSNFVFFAE